MFSATEVMSPSLSTTTAREFRRMSRSTSLKNLDRPTAVPSTGILPGLGSLFADSPSKRIMERSALKANLGREAAFGSRCRLAINPVCAIRARNSRLTSSGWGSAARRAEEALRSDLKGTPKGSSTKLVEHIASYRGVRGAQYPSGSDSGRYFWNL